MATATGGTALDSILGGLGTLGGIWKSNKDAERQSKREERLAAEKRNWPYDLFGGMSATPKKSTPISIQTIAAYGAVAVAFITVIGFTMKLIRG